MKKWKKICIGVFLLSNLSYSEDKVNIEDVTVKGIPTTEALLGEAGDNLTNKAIITVKGNSNSDNSNVTGIRGKKATILNHEKGTIIIDSVQNPPNSPQDGTGGTGIVSNGGKVTNDGKIFIKGKHISGIIGKNNVTLKNVGILNIESSSEYSYGLALKGGESKNTKDGTINVNGKSNVGMEILYNENFFGTQTNEGTITLDGDYAIAMGEKQGENVKTLQTKSINSGKIQGGNEKNKKGLKGMLSYNGGTVENNGNICLSGILAYGLLSENKNDLKPEKMGVVKNTQNIYLKGTLNRGMCGIGVSEVNNTGIISIEGDNGIGIKYYNVPEKGIKNTGVIEIKGNDNWAFATDQTKSDSILSVGKIDIKEGSINSGAFKVYENIKNGVNKGTVVATNGKLNKIIYVKDNEKKGKEVPNKATVENEGMIDIQGGNQNFAVHSKNGLKVTNSGTIKMDDTNGVAIYNPNGKEIINTGEIILSGENQIGIYYENEDINITTTDTGKITIKGTGITAFDVSDGDNGVNGRTDLHFSTTKKNAEVKVFGNVLIDTKAKKSMGAYARFSIKKAINTGNITIKGKDSVGLIGLDGTTLQNDGKILVETKESYGIQAINDATVINNGEVSNDATDGIAIYMGVEDSNLYMDEKSTVIGTVLSKGGVGRFYGKNDFGSNTTHNIDYSLIGFSHMDIKSGNFAVKKDTVLKSPFKNTLAQGHEDTRLYTGNLKILKDKNLTMEIDVNRKEEKGERYTSTIHAARLDIQGTLTYKPLDSKYVVAEDVNEIVVPNIYTNEKINVTDENVVIINNVSGWEAIYRLSSDKTDMSLVLKRKPGGQSLPDSYKNGVWDYSCNFLDKKYLSESIELIDKFEIIEKVHNAELPYYIDAGAVGKSGNYKGGNKKGYFYYDAYGGKLDSYYKIKENLILGLGFTGLESKVKYKHNSNETLNSYILNANIIYKMEGFKIGGYIGTSINKHKLERGITGGDDRYKGIADAKLVNANYESYGLNIGVTGEYKYRISRDSLIRSYASIGYLLNYTEDYKETGNEFYIMNLPSTKEKIPNFKIGSKWEHRNKNRFTELGLNLDYFFDGMIEDRRGNYVFNDKAKYDIASVKLPKYIVSVDLKQEFDINDRLSVYGLISLEMGKKFWQTLGKAGVTYEF